MTRFITRRDRRIRRPKPQPVGARLSTLEALESRTLMSGDALSAPAVGGVGDAGSEPVIVAEPGGDIFNNELWPPNSSGVDLTGGIEPVADGDGQAMVFRMQMSAAQQLVSGGEPDGLVITKVTAIPDV